MTFPDAISEAFDQGWYIYSLGFEPASEGFHDEWHCTLRALSGPPRREISRGKGLDPIEALCAALASTPEPEDEITISTSKTNFEPDTLVLLRRKFGPPPLVRRV